ncbi:holin family protein [Aliiroseovarius sp. 2305UL8-7]|uniref:holin family protein n=1 Tax=Aliiroseovarius conchicola TaxID=3121637 RepID=UPI0035296E4E
MGLIGSIFNVLFGPGGNAVRQTVEVFRENAEAASARDTDVQMAAIDAFRAEFATAHTGMFNRFMDGLNRVPRPALALSTLGLFFAAMISPSWFSARMQSVALVPEPMWWLMGVIVSFYFGARHQIKGQEFQRALAASVARVNAEERLQAVSVFRPPVSAPASLPKSSKSVDVSDNAALADWQEVRRGQ